MASKLSKTQIARRTVKSSLPTPEARRAKINKAAAKVGKTARVTITRSQRG